MKAPVSRLVVGTAQFGGDYGIRAAGQVPEAAVEQILGEAAAAGIEWIDTAPAYGEAEAVIGRVLKRRPDLKFKIITKTDARSGEVRKSVERSLEALGTDRVYGILAHRFDLVKEDPGIAGELAALRREGLCEKTGFSLYSPGEYRWLVSQGIRADIAQIPYSVFDRRFETELEAMNLAAVEVHARSVFLQGLFFIDPMRLPADLVKLAPRIERLRAIAGAHQTEVSAGAMHFALADERFDRVILGVDDLAQWRTNVKAASAPASARLIEELSELAVFDESLILPTRWANARA